MKRAYKLQNLGCANCAAKMERDIQKLSGVNEASINFMTTKLTLDVNDDAFEAVLKQAEDIIHKYEPEVALKRA